MKMMHDEPGSKSDYFETPNLEKFANKGMRFSDAYASAPVQIVGLGDGATSQ